MASRGKIKSNVGNMTDKLLHRPQFASVVVAIFIYSSSGFLNSGQ